MTILDDLKEAVAKRKVMIIAGAGTTIAAVGCEVKHATWTGLIENGLHRAAELGGWTPERLRLYLTMAQSGELGALMAAAQEVASGLGQDGKNGAFGDWLDRTIGTLQAKDTAILDAIAALHCYGLLLATTNYDSLLEKHCAVKPVLISDVGNATSLLRGDIRGILHLHGHYDRPETVILGTAQYQKIVCDPFQTSLQQASALGYSLVFVGCGGTMDDPNVTRLLEWLDTTLIGTRHSHYLLCLEKDIPEWRAKGRNKLLPLSFGTRHADLPAFLTGLLPTAPAKAKFSPPLPTPVAAALVPPPPDYFVGRVTEMGRATKALLLGQHVCIKGTGGIGKTSLTKRIAHDPAIAAAYPRRLFVRLEGTTTGYDAALKVADALGMPPSPHILGLLVHALALEPTLLILDNAETPRDADPAGMESVLSHIGQAAKILLSIRSQQTPTGLEWVRVSLPRLDNVDTRRLFLDIAGGHLSTDPNLPNLLSKTDGVPLAIRLLAAQAEGQDSLRDLWSEWQTIRSRLLQVDGRDDKDGNFTASVMLSLNGPKLTKDGKRLLSMLGQLPEGLSPTMRDELLGTTGPSAQRNLLHLSLAQVEKDRLRLLVPVREVVAAVLPPSSGDATALRARMMAMANEGEKVGRSDGQVVVDRLAPEFGNIIAVLEKHLQDDTCKDVVWAIIRLGEFQRFTGHGATALLLGAVEQTAAWNDTLLQAFCALRLAVIAFGRSNFDEAERQYLCALMLFERVKEVQWRAYCIYGLGDIALYRWSHERARERYNQALPLFQRVRDALGEANCIKSLGDIALCRSSYEEAEVRYEQASLLYHRVGVVIGEANCIYRLGEVALCRSSYGTAEDNFRRALRLFQRTGDVLGGANCVLGLGDIAKGTRESSEAHSHYHQALNQFEQIGAVRSIGLAWHRLVQVAETDADHTNYLARARAAWSTMGEDGQRLIEKYLDPLT